MRPVLVWWWLAVVACTAASPAYGSEFATRRALVVGMAAGSDRSPIAFAADDVRLIQDTLQSRAGYDVEGIMPQRAGDLFERIQMWVNRSGDAQQLVLYFRGQLVCAADRKLYLVADDTDLKRLDETAVSLDSVLAEFVRCPRATIAVYVDAVCDGDHGEMAQRLEETARRLSKLPMEVPPVSLIATTSPSDRRSAMAYWLSRALKGDAAAGEHVQVDGVRDYLVARLHGQSPVAWATTSDRAGQGVVAEIRPRKLEELIADLAEQLATELHRAGAAIVAVPGFDVEATDPISGSIPGCDYGPLRVYVLNRLKRDLARRADFKYRLVEGDSLRELLNENGIGPATIEGAVMRVVGEKLKVPDQSVSLVVGTIRREPNGNQITISCRPWDPNTGSCYEAAEGTALINPSEWAMTGLTAVNPAAMRALIPASSKSHRKNAAGSKARAVKPFPLLDYSRPDDVRQSAELVAQLEKESQKAHPMLDSSFPFRVELVGDHRGKFRSHDRRHMYYRFDNNQQFKIRVTNRSGKPVFLRLLVDGQNTLPDRPLQLDPQVAHGLPFEVIHKDASAAMQPAQFTNLTDATAWHCESGKSYTIDGFYEVVTASGDTKRRMFVVTDAENSNAWKNGFPKDIGIVTAAFYVPVKRPLKMARDGRQGVRMGERKEGKVKVYRGNHVPGDLLAVIHLRYGIPH